MSNRPDHVENAPIREDQEPERRLDRPDPAGIALALTILSAIGMIVAWLLNYGPRTTDH